MSGTHHSGRGFYLSYCTTEHTGNTAHYTCLCVICRSQPAGRVYVSILALGVRVALETMCVCLYSFVFLYVSFVFFSVASPLCSLSVFWRSILYRLLIIPAAMFLKKLKHEIMKIRNILMVSLYHVCLICNMSALWSNMCSDGITVAWGEKHKNIERKKQTTFHKTYQQISSQNTTVQETYSLEVVMGPLWF